MNERPLVESLGDAKLSPYRQYLSMFVGEESLGALAKYELYISVLGRLPGAIGYFVRGKCYPGLLGSVGRGTVFGAGGVLRCPGRIHLGRGVMIDDCVVLDAKGHGSSIVLGDQILLGRNSILSCNDSSMSIGNFVSIGPFCFLVSRSHLTIGSNVAIGAGTHMLGGGHAHDDPDVPVIQQARTSKGITVEDGAWIGIGAKILDGVTIGKNSIVGAGAVVSKDVPPWTVVLGNPARVVEKRKQVNGA
ncbi:MAG TPA: acyltransferase [Nitrospirales bacterium]|nr:acyltransferase [Nitrospirales bacterium]